MTRERDERMWNLAYRLAQSGEHRNCQAIEWELRAFRYPRARQLLYHERVREKLDGICAEFASATGSDVVDRVGRGGANAPANRAASLK